MAIYSGFTHWKWWFSIIMLIYRRVCCLHHQYHERRTSRKTATSPTSPWGSDSANVQLGASRSLLDAVQMSLGARGDVFWGRQGWIKLEITMVIAPISWDITPISVCVYIYICTSTCIINYTYINYKYNCTPKCRPDAYGIHGIPIAALEHEWIMSFPSLIGNGMECHHPNWLEKVHFFSEG